MTPEGKGNEIAPYGYYLQTFGDLKKLLGSDKDPRTPGQGMPQGWQRAAHVPGLRVGRLRV